LVNIDFHKLEATAALQGNFSST